MNLRHAVRSLLRTPGFACIAVLTLALGIGLNTVVFSLYEAVVLKPIAARAPDQLVRIAGSQDGRPIEAFTYAQYDQVRTRTISFSDVIASTAPQTVVGTHGGRSRILRVRLVSSNYFESLGVTLHLGRGFLPGDIRTAVASSQFWRHQLDADPNAVSQSIAIHGVPLDIVGVAPDNFAGTGVPPTMPDLWIPMAAQREVLPGVDWLHESSSAEWQLLARRRSGASAARASAELEVLASGWPLVNGKPAHLSARSATFFQADRGEFDTFVWVCGILMIAVVMILLIGSINLVNLLFARQASREQEFAVRVALGAGRMHLVRQLCAESLLLGVAGGTAGLLFSMWACEAIRSGIDFTLERITNGALGVYLDFTPDWRIFAFTAAMSIFAGLAIGLWPALWASRRNIHADLKQTAGSGDRGFWSKRNLLITAQVASCLVLLAAAGLLFRGVWRSAAVSPGFETRHLMLAAIDPQAVAPTAEARLALLHKAIDRLEALPQVESLAYTDRAPFLGHGIAGFETEKKARVRCLFSSVSRRYFETVGLPILEGRVFTPEEIAQDAPVVLINDVAARQAWPGQDPLGRRITLAWPSARHQSATVIGVVKGARTTYLSKPDFAYVYMPMQLEAKFGMILLRTRELPDAAARAVIAELASIDPNLPSQTQTAEIEKGPMEIQRLMAEAPAGAAFVLGTLALLLASLGIFALVAQLVAQRTREIAIRVAVGATGGDVVRLVLMETLRPVAMGAVVGLAGASGISMLLRASIAIPDMPDLTYGAGAFAPAVFSGALAALLAVIVAATFVPIRRAIRIAPAEALRNE